MIRRIFTKKVKGAISLFLTIVMVGLLTVNSIIVDGLRYHSGEVFLQGAVDLSAHSVLSNYDAQLLELFGIFALSQEYDTNEEYINYLTTTLMTDGGDVTYSDRIQEILTDLVYTSLGDEGTSGRVLDLYKFDNVTANVDTLYNLSEPNVLNKQIVEYMKYRAPYKLVAGLDGVPGSGVLETMESFRTAGKISQISEDKIIVDEAISGIMQYTYEASRNIEVYNKYDPSKILDKIHDKMIDLGNIIIDLKKKELEIAAQEEKIKKIEKELSQAESEGVIESISEELKEANEHLNTLESSYEVMKINRKRLQDEANELTTNLRKYFQISNFQWSAREVGRDDGQFYNLGDEFAMLNNIDSGITSLKAVKENLDDVLTILDNFLEEYDCSHSNGFNVSFGKNECSTCGFVVGSEEDKIRILFVEDTKALKKPLDILAGRVTTGTGKSMSIDRIIEILEESKVIISDFETLAMNHATIVSSTDITNTIEGAFDCDLKLYYFDDNGNFQINDDLSDYTNAYNGFMKYIYVPHENSVDSDHNLLSHPPLKEVIFEDPMKELRPTGELPDPDGDFRDSVEEDTENSHLNKKPDLVKSISLEGLPSQEGPKFSPTNDAEDKAYVEEIFDSILSAYENNNSIYEYQDNGTYVDNEKIANEVLDSIEFDEPGWFQKKITAFLSFFSNKEKDDSTFGEKSFGIVSIMLQDVMSALEDGRNNIYANEYIMFTFKNRLTDLYYGSDADSPTSPTNATSYDKDSLYEVKHRYNKEIDLRAISKTTRNTGLDAEVEYILKGKDNDKDNTFVVARDIFLIRMATNTGAILSNAEIMKKIRALSYSISAATGLPWAGEVVSWLLITAWGTAETTLDMVHLIDNGYSVFLLKNSKNLDKFNLGFSTIITGQWDILTPKIPLNEDYKNNSRIQYEDYLRIFLFLMPYEEKMLRIADLIEINMMEEGDTKFKSKEASTFIRVETTATMDYLFLNQPFVGKTIDDDKLPKGKLNLKKLIYQGY